jgi:cytochrome c6
MNRKLLVVFSLALAAVAGTAVASEDPTAALYNKSCASCHGKDGKGNPALTKMLKVDLALLDMVDEATLAKTDEELDAITANGHGKMPAYKDKLTVEQIESLTAYIRGLAPEEDVEEEDTEAVEK